MPRYTIVLLMLTLLAPTRLLADGPARESDPVTVPTGSPRTIGNDSSSGNHGPGSLPVGTTITMQNWQNFRQFMSDGMVALFEGKYFWKMPADVSMQVGTPIDYPLPKNYIEATEKYASQVKIIELPDGGLTLANYRGGMPFPNPQEPHRGWKILANLWYRYMPHLIAQTYGYTCGLDAMGASNCITLQYVLRQFAFNTDPGFTPASNYNGIFFTNWFMVLEPEQQKYLTTLSIVYADLARAEDSYVFLPSLRRYQALSASARCSTTAGTDATHDDYEFGFDSNLTQLKVDYVAHRRILTLADAILPKENFPEGFDLPLGWPRPSMGKWQLRDVDEISVSRLPSSGGSICYSKRVLYVDSHFYTPLWVENYGTDLKPERFHAIFPHTVDVPGIGPVNASGADVEVFWNLVTNHATFTVEPALGGKHYINDEAPAEFDDIPRYSTPSGLNLIMR